MYLDTLAVCPPLQVLPGLSFLGPFGWTSDLSSVSRLLIPGVSATMLVALGMMRSSRSWRRLVLASAGLLACLAGFYLAELVFAGWIHSLETWQANAEAVVLDTPNIHHVMCVDAVLGDQSYIRTHQQALILYYVSWIGMLIGYLVTAFVFFRVMNERYGQSVALSLRRMIGSTESNRRS